MNQIRNTWLLAVITFATLVMVEDVFAADPIAWYPMDGSAEDISGNGHHGTRFGNTSFTTDIFGDTASALLFDGSSGYVEIPYDAAFDHSGLNSLTFTYLMMLLSPIQNLGATVCKGGLIDVASDGISDYCFPIVETGHMYVEFNHHSMQSQAEELISNSAVEANKWVYVAIVFDETLVSIYLNGSLDASAVLDSASYTDNDSLPVYIGVDADGGEEYFHGVLDEIRVYGSALSSDEIATLYPEATSVPIEHQNIPISWGALKSYFK